MDQTDYEDILEALDQLREQETLTVFKELEMFEDHYAAFEEWKNKTPQQFFDDCCKDNSIMLCETQELLESLFQAELLTQDVFDEISQRIDQYESASDGDVSSEEDEAFSQQEVCSANPEPAQKQKAAYLENSPSFAIQNAKKHKVIS
jgi:hypothetical protein